MTERETVAVPTKHGEAEATRVGAFDWKIVYPWVSIDYSGTEEQVRAAMERYVASMDAEVANDAG